MRVRELVEKLQKLDQSLEVVCMREDGESYEVFDISHVDDIPTRTHTERGDDGRVRFQFEDRPGSRPILYINITADF